MFFSDVSSSLCNAILFNNILKLIRLNIFALRVFGKKVVVYKNIFAVFSFIYRILYLCYKVTEEKQQRFSKIDFHRGYPSYHCSQ